MKIASVVLIALCIPIAASAQTRQRSSSVCLRPNRVWGWTVVDNQTLIVSDRTRNLFKVSLMPGCLDLNWHLRLAFRTFSGSNIACMRRGDLLLVPPQAGRPAQRCRISDVVTFVPPPTQSN